MSEMVQTLSRVGEYWLSDPARAIEAQTSLFAGYMNVWNNSIRRLAGEVPAEPIEPTKGDKRFADPEWDRNFFFSFIKQAYILTAQWADDLVERAEGLDPHTRHKAAFYMRQISNAIAPSNFIATNPELYRETVASNGENLVRGMKMFAEDMAAGRGNLRLRQADYSCFEVGRDMAVTPGKVIAQNDVCQVIQYAPQTETVFKRPLMIVPPWINKFYILDLKPEKSLIKLAGRPGAHGLRDLVDQPGREAGREGLGRLHPRKASSSPSTRSRRRPASARSTPSATASAAPSSAPRSPT